MRSSSAYLRLSRRAVRAYHRSRGWRWGSSGNYASIAGPPGGRYPTDNDFAQIFVGHSGRLAHKWAHYFEAYSEQLTPYRDGFVSSDGSRRPLRFLEIGVSHGGSLQLWRKFFGPDATIVGIDVDPRCAAFDDDVATVRIGSQNDTDFLTSIVAEIGGVDVVVDDGSHVARDQRAAFATLFPLLSSGGVYVVEDLHTSYWANFGGGYRRRGAFIEVVKNLLDDMHHWYHGNGHRVDLGDGAVRSMSLYDSLAFIYKGDPVRPMTIRAGEPSF